MAPIDFTNIQDISSWERQPDTSIVGTRDKIVLRSPESNKLCFMKFPKSTASPEIQLQEILTEHIATEIAKSLRIETHNCFPAIYNGQLGINNLMLVQETDMHLVYPKQLIQEDLQQSDQSLPSDRTGYRSLHTVDNVLDIFCQYCSGYEDFFEEKFLPGFLEMILYDALVGMMDRHWENYAVLKRIYISVKKTFADALETFQTNPELLPLLYKALPNFDEAGMLQFEISDMSFAPIYDNGSCLFWNLDDTRIPSTPERFLSYSTHKKAWSQIGIPNQDKCNLFELVTYLLNKTYINKDYSIDINLAPILYKKYTKLDQNYSSSLIKEIILKGHFGLFSDTRINLMQQYVDFRKGMLDNILKQQ